MKVTELAEYIVRYYNSVGDVVSNKKLNKVLYYIQGWHLAYFEGDLIFKEVPQAWVHGPVYPEVYQNYRGENNIQRDEAECAPNVLNDMINSFNLSSDQKDFLAAMLIHYSKKSGAELEVYTHREEPWLEGRGDLAPHIASNREISIETMRSHFSGRIASTKDKK